MTTSPQVQEPSPEGPGCALLPSSDKPALLRADHQGHVGAQVFILCTLRQLCPVPTSGCGSTHPDLAKVLHGAPAGDLEPPNLELQGHGVLALGPPMPPPWCISLHESAGQTRLGSSCSTELPQARAEIQVWTGLVLQQPPSLAVSPSPHMVIPVSCSPIIRISVISDQGPTHMLSFQ